jgi:hypothetical protein
MTTTPKASAVSIRSGLEQTLRQEFGPDVELYLNTETDASDATVYATAEATAGAAGRWLIDARGIGRIVERGQDEDGYFVRVVLSEAVAA